MMASRKPKSVKEALAAFRVFLSPVEVSAAAQEVASWAFGLMRSVRALSDVVVEAAAGDGELLGAYTIVALRELFGSKAVAAAAFPVLESRAFVHGLALIDLLAPWGTSEEGAALGMLRRAAELLREAGSVDAAMKMPGGEFAGLWGLLKGLATESLSAGPSPVGSKPGPAVSTGGWEVTCPDGVRRHLPYLNQADALAYALRASDPAWFAERGSCLGPPPSPGEEEKPPCPGGQHGCGPVALDIDPPQPARSRAN